MSSVHEARVDLKTCVSRAQDVAATAMFVVRDEVGVEIVHPVNPQPGLSITILVRVVLIVLVFHLDLHDVHDLRGWRL